MITAAGVANVAMSLGIGLEIDASTEQITSTVNQLAWVIRDLADIVKEHQDRLDDSAVDRVTNGKILIDLKPIVDLLDAIDAEFGREFSKGMAAGWTLSEKYWAVVNEMRRAQGGAK